MPNPKHKHSKTRRDRRRTHDALSQPALSRCPQCQEMRTPHRVCPHCGFYGGREVMEPREH
jgi:large subunit ribosomal protein L32